MEAWIGLALNKWTVFTAGGIFFVMRTLTSVHEINENRLFGRIRPFIPEVLGLLSAFTGGLPIVEGQSIPIKIAAGLWCAYFAKSFHKFLQRTVVGIDHVRDRKVIPQ